MPPDAEEEEQQPDEKVRPGGRPEARKAAPDARANEPAGPDPLPVAPTVSPREKYKRLSTKFDPNVMESETDLASMRLAMAVLYRASSGRDADGRDLLGGLYESYITKAGSSKKADRSEATDMTGMVLRSSYTRELCAAIVAKPSFQNRYGNQRADSAGERKELSVEMMGSMAAAIRGGG